MEYHHTTKNNYVFKRFGFKNNVSTFNNPFSIVLALMRHKMVVGQQNS